jgi:hypothetical protein
MERGAEFRGHSEVTSIGIDGGRVRTVSIAEETIPADVVVSCVGIWGPRIGRMVGMPVPLVPMQHQYAISSPLPELHGETREVAYPTIRHQDRDLYMRQHHDRYGVGSYQNRPMPVSADDLLPFAQAKVMPSVLDFTPEDFEQAWIDAGNLMPAFRSASIQDAINGIFSFTTDGFPLLGESHDVKGFWIAEAVWITHAVGVAQAMAEWIVDGVPSIDLRQCDIQRFEPYALSHSYLERRSAEGYAVVYDIRHPLEPMEEPRPLRMSPYYARQKDLGACFLEASGWERPQWYEANAALVDGLPIPDREPWSARYWSPIVGAEHLVTRERVGMYDMTSLPKIDVAGSGAVNFLQRLTTGIWTGESEPSPTR